MEKSGWKFNAPVITASENVVPECQRCFDEEGSYSCIRPFHKQSAANKETKKTFDPTGTIPGSTK